MLIGVPKEIKDNEFRVGMTSASIAEAVHHGHEVMVEAIAGLGIDATDDHYRQAGAKIVDTAEEIFSRADLIVKVKEPQPGERKMLREDQVLFTYLHLAPDPEQTKDLVESDSICIAYETVTDVHGGLPLLAPMSQVAGRMSVQAGAYALEMAQGGRGVLLAGVPGVQPANVVIVGGGVAGENAAYMALGMGADVTVLDRNVDTMRALVVRFGPALKTIYSTRLTIEEQVLAADLVIGAVLVPGAEAPKLISKAMVKEMKKGAVLVDIAIDQGGCLSVKHRLQLRLEVGTGSAGSTPRLNGIRASCTPASASSSHLSRPAERVVAFYNHRGIHQGRQVRHQVDAAVMRRRCGSLHALAIWVTRTLALPKEVVSLTTPTVVRHGRYVTFQLAEAPRNLFVLTLIDDLRRRQADGKVRRGVSG